MSVKQSRHNMETVQGFNSQNPAVVMHFLQQASTSWERLNLPKQRPQLETTCSNTRAGEGRFNFNSDTMLVWGGWLEEQLPDIGSCFLEDQGHMECFRQEMKVERDRDY